MMKNATPASWMVSLLSGAASRSGEGKAMSTTLNNLKSRVSSGNH